MGAFYFRVFSRGDDADHAATVALTVTDEQKMSTAAHAQHEKALLVRGMGLVVELHGEFVVEDRLGFFEGNAMFPEVRGGFGRVPVKSNHLYIVWMVDAFATPRA